MNAHLRKDLERLKAQIVREAIAVESNVRKSVKALRELSVKLAEDVVKSDYDIDKTEVDIEEECLKILALHQPVASDLRLVITVLKINNELEHIGDVAVNIAKRIPFMVSEEKSEVPFDFDTVTSRAVYMLKCAIDSFLEEDEHLALGVCRDDEIIDNENRKCYGKVREIVDKTPRSAMLQMNYLLVSKSLERIGDLCTNIAEDIIYMKRSIIVRHNLENAIREMKRADEEEE